MGREGGTAAMVVNVCGGRGGLLRVCNVGSAYVPNGCPLILLPNQNFVVGKFKS